MPFSAALTTDFPTTQAAEELAATARTQLGRDPLVAIAFYSPHHAANAAELAYVLAEQTGARALLGVLGESVVGGSREVEDEPAIALWLAAWDDAVTVDAFHLDMAETPDGPSLFGWPDAVLEADPTKSLLIAFGDPHTFPAAEVFLPRVNEDYPGLTVAGGMASSPMGPGTPSIFLNGEVKEQGAVGLLIQRAKFRTVVSQGCRPVGRPLVITNGEDNVIAEVGGQTPLEYLRGLLMEVSASERNLMQRGLLIGIAMSEYHDEFRRGDFVVRNLVGLDPRTGALALTDRIRRGQTVQFHVRDAASADADLRDRLKSATAGQPRAGGGLVFTCNGRGTRLFNTPDHDAKAIQAAAGPIPLAGFFAAGELGPVGNTNFIHGFTASTVLFE
ncbi:MAG TPA: FIST N-terminal domain-containing protein [Gemmataceae bacterium]|jgi:small ligand-binding sensory domain FIST|nr:FIST N-terminal domain-containing protein [Gemmataceae bacterium]